MQQISVRGVQLDQLCARSLGTTRGCGKSLNDGPDLCHGKGLGNLVAVGKSQCTGREDWGPASLGRSDWLAAIPGLVSACLSAGMGQLDTRNGALFGNKREDEPQGFNVRVLPDAQVLGADAALGGNRCSLRNHGSGTPHGPAAQVDKVPVSGKSVCAGILAHG